MNQPVVYTWADIANALKLAPPGKLWGVPRGGAIVAGLTGRAVDRLEDADVVVDDIVDSGATRKRYEDAGKKFWALHTKQPGEGWVIFPWEHPDPLKDNRDTVIRQLELIGEDPTRDGLKDTPDRVLRALKEMTGGYGEDPGDILGRVFDEKSDELVMVRRVPFTSLCEHHMLPFTGHATVGYLPGEKVVGLSKLPRLVNCFARRLQMQERLTQQVAKAMQEHLAPRGVGVVLVGEHQCMSCRGVRATGADMVTSAMLGVLRDNPAARAEFLALARL